jgi:chitinase
MRPLTYLIMVVCILASLVFAVSVGAAPAQADRGPWAPNTAYAVNDTVTYGGCTYKVIQAHTSLTGWEPPVVPALFQQISCGVVNTPTRTNTSPAVTNTPSRTPTRTFTPGGPTSTVTRTPTRTSTMSITSTPTRTNTVPAITNTPSRTPTVGVPTGTLPKHALIGYWHNFDNGSGFIPLRNISTKWDLVIVAFGEPSNGPTNGTIGFVPYPSYYTSASMFASDVAYLRSIGKKVLISIGGANGLVQLTSTSARDNFVNSVGNIISTYGFDGLDIDFENQSLVLNAGDTDPTAPTTPSIVNTISAIRSIQSRFGSNFILTMAPETFFVQLGYSFYGGTCSGCDRRAGAFLPVIYANRDILTVLHVQDYNSGPIIGLDGAYHTMGGADFHIAMLDMLLAGFPVAGTGKTFPALRADQVALGIPAMGSAGNGYVAPATVQQALDYIIKGTPTGSYVKRSANATNFRGVMTWSINWDAFGGVYEFSNFYRNYLNSLP